VYEAVAESVGRALGFAVELVDGGGYERLGGGEEDVAFIYGLPYVRLAEGARPTVEPLAAPILDGDRHGGRPIYYSDVIVRRDSSATCFADLRGASWAFNEPDSQSGYGITGAALASMGETRGFFGRVVQMGFHQRSTGPWRRAMSTPPQWTRRSSRSSCGAVRRRRAAVRRRGRRGL
jgi:phosphonate transport system substrate-binding protein